MLVTTEQPTCFALYRHGGPTPEYALLVRRTYAARLGLWAMLYKYAKLGKIPVFKIKRVEVEIKKFYIIRMRESPYGLSEWFVLSVSRFPWVPLFGDLHNLGRAPLTLQPLECFCGENMIALETELALLQSKSV